MEGKELEKKAVERNKKNIELEEAEGREEIVTCRRRQRNVVNGTNDKSIKKVLQAYAI